MRWQGGQWVQKTNGVGATVWECIPSFISALALPPYVPPSSGGSGGGGGEPAKTCQVTLAARQVVGTTYFHLFIVLAEFGGFQIDGQTITDPLVWHAFPDKVEGKYLEGEVNKFIPGDRDYDSAKANGIREAGLTLYTSCDTVRKSLDDSLAKINDKKFLYPSVLEQLDRPTNSNAFAYTLLTNWDTQYRDILKNRLYNSSFSPFSTPGLGVNLLQ